MSVNDSAKRSHLHKGRFEIYARLLVSCELPTIQIDLLRKAECQQRDVKYVEDLVRKGCLDKKKVGDGDWSRIRYTLTEKGRVYAENFRKVVDILDN